MQKNTEHIPNRDDVSTAILQHLDGLRGIDTHCHHLPDDQFQNMGVKFLYDHSYCNWMDDLLGLLHSYSNVYADLCWLPLISTSAAKRFLREALEIGGSNRILWGLSLIHISEPTRRTPISYAVFCLKKKKIKKKKNMHRVHLI